MMGEKQKSQTREYMKTLVLLLLFPVSLILSCEKDTYQSTGTIIGPDIRMCVCCGGYFIETDGNQYLFEKSELPANFTFTDSQLPLHVKLDWKPKTGGCAGFNRITISRIRAIP